GYILEDIEQFKKMQADKTISLNEKQRLKEKEESDARDKARNEERLTRKEPNEKLYELTLRQLELPLQLIQKTNTTVAKASPPRVDWQEGKLTQPKATGAGVSTNSASVASAKVGLPSPGSSDGSETDEEKAAVPDVSLVEAEHI